MQVKILHNQTLLDIAIQQYGTASAAFDLALANGISLTADLEVGNLLEIPLDDYGAGLIANYYKANKLKPATAIEVLKLTEVELPSGIDYWAIEFDFIVS
ncbi:hypothetical protein QP547_04710 [Weeksella virosa]|uniref:hypothetical protein n=1 Tax=Weeksella virosa TaxID=1014 RepID=UPI0025550CEC|nr:hypothetical protein [Weeksella virosa]MDK7675111.1 hypothetical protein [Weeksella virosa]